MSKLYLAEEFHQIFINQKYISQQNITTKPQIVDQLYTNHQKPKEDKDLTQIELGAQNYNYVLVLVLAFRLRIVGMDKETKKEENTAF